LTAEGKLNYGKMTSSVSTDGALYLPLIFFFNRNPGLALPLIALQYHEVRLDIDLASDFTDFVDSSKTFKVWGNYVYLDTEERRRFAQKGHEYLIEQVQHTGSDSITVGSQKQIRLSYNHPVKELVWCTDVDSSNLWNFTSGAPLALTSNIVGLAAVSNVAVAPNALGAPIALADENTKFSEDTAGPLDTFKLVLNGQDRFKEQGGKYFNAVQPYNHHSGSPLPGIYSYSFALKPEEHQPTGTCNFSRIDNAQVAIKTKAGSEKNTLHMFAVNYNVLRIQSGMGGLAFSN
jgi:hypothetical protein